MASAPTTPPGALTPVSAPSSRPTTPGLSTPPPTSAPAKDGAGDDSSKLKLIISILRKFIGVADIANVRFSLPSQLIEPIPNLEYWHYVDRPDTFTSIGKSDDELGRMLEVLRFWFTKDLKFVKGKPCKPYNSTLGEFFRCNWEIREEAPAITTPSKAPAQPSLDPLQPENDESPVRISYITEQTSHHPPISAYWVECPARGLVARGYDQISAKFSGTYVRVVAGSYNKGLWIEVKNRGEEYHMNHPDSQLNGFLRGSLYISVADVVQIRCKKTRLKAILHYVEESYFGKAQNKVIGVVYRYDPDNDKYSKPKDVPEKEVLCSIEGDWKDKLYYTIPSNDAVKKYPGLEPTKSKQLIMDVGPLMPVPKIVPPPEEQLDNESRKLWDDVTQAIMEKRFGDATQKKQDIEQLQRDKAAEREQAKKTFKPRFFTHVTESNGKPELTEEGRKVLDDMQKLSFHLEPRADDSMPIENAK